MEAEPEPDLCQLLQMMLESALLGKPYPGQSAPGSFFPDAEMVEDLPEIVISRRNLDDPCQIDVPGRRVMILSEDEIATRAASEGDFPYFSLTEATFTAGEATLSLQLSWAVSEASKQAGVLPFGGGGVRVRFEWIAGEWQAPSGPISTWMA
ncbi:MAG: hypothetical protein ACE5H9_22050 [Anaerolineae bacterium]